MAADPFENNIRNEYKDDGTIITTLIARDITERKKIEEENAFQSLLLNNIHDNIIATDLDGNIIYANSSEAQILNINMDRLIGQPVTIFGENPNKGATQQQIIDNTCKYGKWRTEVINYASDGSEIVFDCRTKLINNIKGKPTSLIGISTDITELKLKESKLKRYAETQEVLVREVNHRVKNNLSALISMLHKIHDNEQSKGFPPLPIIGALEDRIRGLSNIHSLLSEGGWQPIKLSDICRQIIGELLDNLLLSRKINLNVTESDILMNSNQAHHITMVLNELATNTVKYSFASIITPFSEINIAS